MDGVRKLQIGEKYTIAAFSYMGMPYRSNFTLCSIRCDAFQQFAETYLLTVKTAKRKFIDIRLKPDKQFIIWEGWVEPNVDLTVSMSIRDYDSGPVQVAKRWRYFDARYMERAARSVREEPLISHYTPAKPDHGPLFEICEIIS